jgi:hypothetical protein
MYVRPIQNELVSGSTRHQHLCKASMALLILLLCSERTVCVTRYFNASDARFNLQ